MSRSTREFEKPKPLPWWKRQQLDEFTIAVVFSVVGVVILITLALAHG